MVAVFAVREGVDHELTALTELEVRGLDDSDARALLDSVLPGLLDPRVQMIAQGLDSSLTSPSDAQVNGPPEAPAILSPVGPDDEAITEDTVQTGTGSYELWRRKAKKSGS